MRRNANGRITTIVRDADCTRFDAHSSMSDIGFGYPRFLAPFCFFLQLPGEPFGIKTGARDKKRSQNDQGRQRELYLVRVFGAGQLAILRWSPPPISGIFFTIYYHYSPFGRNGRATKDAGNESTTPSVSTEAPLSAIILAKREATPSDVCETSAGTTP